MRHTSAPIILLATLLATLVGLASACDSCATPPAGPGDPDAGQDGDDDDDDDDDEDAGPDVCATILCGSPAVCCGEAEECVNDACVDECGSGVRCGADQLECCGGDEVCLSDVCVSPTTACADSFDCGEGEFCEPTLGQCLPQPVDGALCEVRPDFAAFTADLEWEWLGHTDAPGAGADPATYSNVCVTPVVADVDVDGTPDVVFGAYPTGADQQVRLFVIDGATGVEKLALPVAELRLLAFQGLAIGNVDADPELEIVGMAAASSLGAGVFILDDMATTPTLKCAVNTGSLPSAGGSIALANMDADPQPELVAGGVIIDASCTVAFDARAGIGFGGDPLTVPACVGRNGNGCIPTLADLDGDVDQDGAGNPLPEIVGGTIAYRFDPAAGLWQVMWDQQAGSTPGFDGFTAVADVDTTLPGPEVAVVADGKVFMRNGQTGAVIPFDTGVEFATIGGRGGPPTIADFDGDGRLEIAAAGNASYRVYDFDCKATRDPALCAIADGVVGVLWEKATQDLSSSNTGSSVFDFQGDGAAEVVYNDECFLRVYDGATGDVLFESENSSRTSTEFPIVVDVDADGRSEFVVAGNNDQIVRDNCPYCVDGQPCSKGGVFAFGDPLNQWVRTRSVWNEHAYHVTNISQAGEVPAVEPNNWETPGLNNYRQNVQGEGVFNAPDLALTGLAADLSQCPVALVLQARVANLGSLGVGAGVPVTFYAGDDATGELLGTVLTTRSLLPGASETIILELESTFGGAPTSFFVTVGADGAVLECDSENNDAATSGIECSFIAG